MSNNTVSSKSLGGVFFAVLFAVFGNVACGGGGGGSTPAISDPADPNLIGINIAAPLDYEENRLYANVISTSRKFIAGLNENSTTLATVDANGWPTSDFSFYVWAGIGNMHGTYSLSFTGQASVGSNIGNLPVTYDSTTNTSTGTFQYANAASSSLALRFSNTKLTSSSPLGSGVTSIKLMRPLTPGSSQSYPPSTLFNDAPNALISKFSVIRFMDFLATNWNSQVNWSDRPLPSWASFNRFIQTNGYGWQGIGGPLEHVILLSNESGKDAWVNIPSKATDDYVLKVAQIFAYGSDGVNPYTSPQANPIYPPLNASLNVYIEYSNELWNNMFTQFNDNCQAASDELVSTTGNSPLNWDGIWNTSAYPNANWNYSMCWRRIAKRSVEISNIFRSVFGDAAMMTRIRPVLMTQLGTPGASLFDGTKMMLDYYNNMGGNFVTTPHPPSRYLYGAGGSGYYNPATTVSSLDEFFASSTFTPAGFAPRLQADAKYVAAMGLKRIAYEGGPSLDKTNGVRDAISAQAVEDPRMTTTVVDMHNTWSSNSGGLLVYFTATGDYPWGFTPDIYNLSTPKLLAIDALNATDRTPSTFGTPVPGSIAGNTADACSRDWGCSPIQSWDNFTADGSKIIWASYSFRSSESTPWSVNLSFTSASSNASVAVYIDGALVGTQATTGGALSFNTGTVNQGLHGVIVRAVTGTFSLDSIAVALN